jgi:uncharacterized protein YoxC
MSDVVGIIAVVLAAVLVGAVIPVLYNAAQTLKSARVFIETTGPRVEETLGEITAAVSRLNRIAAALEDEGRKLKPLVDSAAGLGQTLERINETARTAGSLLGALTPALIAGVKAFFSGRKDSGGPGTDDDVEASAAERDTGSRPDVGAA